MMHPYATAVLRNQCVAVAGAAVGTRNASLNTAACKVGHYVPTYITYLEATDALTCAANQAGLTGTEVEATIRSGLKFGMSEPRIIPELEGVQQSAGAVVGEEVPDDPTHAFPRLDWHALFADEGEDEWIIEPLIPAGRLVAIYSAPKVGKSLLMLEIAVGIARGSEVLGVTPDRPRRVLYVDHENDPRGDVRARLEDMDVAPEQLDDLVYLSFPAMAVLDSALGGAQLLATAQGYGAEVVVVDTVSRAVAGEENSNDTWLSFYRNTGVLLKRAGITLVRLDHSGKNPDLGQRGASAKAGDVDVLWRLSEEVPDVTFRLQCEANRLPVPEKTVILHRETQPALRHRVDALGSVGAWRSKRDAVVKALDSAGLDNHAERRACLAALRSGGHGFGSRIVDEAVRFRRQRPYKSLPGCNGFAQLYPPLSDPG